VVWRRIAVSRNVLFLMQIILNGHDIVVTAPMVVVGLYIDSVTALIIYYVRRKRHARIRNH
jgi:hypothetical protein